MTAEEALAEARLTSERLNASLPSLVRAGELTHKSKLPFKAVSIRELLMHRVSALSCSAVDQFESKEVISGIVLTRAIVETVAVLYCLNKRLEQFVAAPGDVEEERLDDFLMKSLVGARWEEHPVQAQNVLSFIDKVSKEIELFRESYDSLSEYAHPNWSGMLGTYGEFNRERMELVLGNRTGAPGMRSGCTVLATALDIFAYTYNSMSETLHAFNAYFESKPAHAST